LRTISRQAGVRRTKQKSGCLWAVKERLKALKNGGGGVKTRECTPANGQRKGGKTKHKQHRFLGAVRAPVYKTKAKQYAAGNPPGNAHASGPTFGKEQGADHTWRCPRRSRLAESGNGEKRTRGEKFGQNATAVGVRGMRRRKKPPGKKNP